MKTLAHVLLLLTIGSSNHAAAGDWPHQRGPDHDGTVAAVGTFGDAVVLETAWRVPLGSGYSAVVVADGYAVTMFAEGDADWVAAFEVASGERAWSQRLGPRTKGLDGADDGPLSSPTIGGARVFALAADGKLFALSLADGAVAWVRDLVVDIEAARPHFGFTTSPLFVDGKVVVQVGGTHGRSIVGLDARDGTTSWTVGNDAVEYQSPTPMTLAGRRQIVAVGTRALVGLDIESGKQLWVHDLGEEAGTASAMPVFAGADRVYLPKRPGAAVFRVTRDPEGFAVQQLYETEELGNSYARPVHRDAHLYGFRGQVLTCIDAETGERRWRSRPPGGDGLILVDGRLVVFGAKGNVVVVEASPEGYRELARVEALAGSSLTWPSFADGRIFVRNLEQLAAVRVVQGTPAAETAAAPEEAHALSRWTARSAAADPAARRELVEQLWAEHPRLPWLDGEWVHFLYRGEARDVSVAGTMLDTDAPEAMRRVEGTDLFHRSYRLEAGGRWEYRFQVDFEGWVLDPRNPRSVPEVEGDGRMSELVDPGFPVVDYSVAEGAARGKLDELELRSEILGYEKTVTVWLPPGYESAEARYPLIVVNDGDAWREKGDLVGVLDSVVGREVGPVVVAFVPQHAEWWLEAGGGRTGDYARMLVEELVPALEARYRLADGPEARGVMGNRFFGLTAVYVALRHPGSFGRVGAQSIFSGLGAEDELDALNRAGAAPGTRFYLDWNRWDERNIDRGWDFAGDSRALDSELREAGHHVEGGEQRDSYGWGGWRNRSARLLRALAPPRPPPPEAARGSAAHGPA